MNPHPLPLNRANYIAHGSIPGKFIHGDDIQNNEKSSRELMQSDEAKARKAKYRDFIKTSKPE